ncbi:MAG: NUDIX domain-containing protein [Clostridia bacterium]|nr:NUDIX domain-containing protein [Clostridia bacterium]
MEYDCGFTKENNWFRYRAAAIIVEDGCVLLVGNASADYLYSVGGGVHMNERAEDAVVREVFEETGVRYEIDRLAVIHENFWDGSSDWDNGLHCHELAFYYLMKPRGTRELCSNSVTRFDDREVMHWIPIEDLDRYNHFPTFLKDYLTSTPAGIVHIVTDERAKK